MSSGAGALTATRAFCVGDLVAGISVALVLVPQAVAYAALAGLPPVCGLYAAVLPPILAAFFVSSPYLQTGPVAMTSVLTFAALAAHATPGTTAYIEDAAALALIVGLVRVAIGVLRAGFVAYLMSQPVLTGFTTAAALLIMASQFPTLAGMAADGGILAGASRVVLNPGEWCAQSLGIGAASMAVILGGRRLHRLFPGVLVAVVLGILWQESGFFHGALVGPLPSGLPTFGWSLSFDHLRELLLPGVIIAVVGFAEPAAVARTMATRDREPWSADRELISQGVANLAAGISGGFPVGGSFTRTSLNRLAGGRTRWSGAITGVAVLAFLPFAGVLADLPRAVLAAILIVSAQPLVALGALWRMVSVSRAQAAVGWLTFVLTLALAPRVDLAILGGIGLGVAVHLWRERRIVVNSVWDETSRTLTLVPIGVVYFGSANVIDDALIDELARHPAAKSVLIDLRKVGRIDYTGMLVIQNIANDAALAGLELRIVPGQPPQGVRLLERVLGADSPFIVRESS
ncbi:MAG: SulP family inorganic anion transporter [Gammaproteobacteria bacterium]|nr:SulP family inorganic anion transporter [Gammaproteobacteria bacterium]MBI5616038.1 SulP family inorganic anion transporter [Gammaproteobacteria bacterium]